MRWKVMCVSLLAALAVTAGCKQQMFVSESQLNDTVTSLRSNLIEKDPTVGAQPIIDRVAAPPTVLDPDRKIRYISLAEAVSIALEQGTVGNQVFTTAPLETYSDSEVTFNGRASLTDSIRVLAMDPAAVGANIDLALSKFDALWTSSMTWNSVDQPVATTLQQIQSGGLNAIEQETAQFSTAVLKPLPTGGVAGITFDTNYTLSNTPQRLNPAYQPTLQFEFEQPLLQGFGVEINQLRQNSPGSLLLPNGGALGGLPQPGVEGILVTRIRFDQQRAEFQRTLNVMLANTEFSYWNLYNAYWNLYANEAALRQAYEAWKIAEVKLQAGSIAVADLAQTRGQYELFRSNRLSALAGVLEAEREMRGILGMHAEDGFRLVPSDSPTLAAYQPDWSTSLEEALNNAPSLLIAREEVKANQLNLRLAENALLPDLRFGAVYDINSIGSRLDGPDAKTNAFKALASDHFNDWTLALRLNVPIGFRNAYTNVRIQKLNLARAYETLAQQELKIERALTRAYQTVFVDYEQIKALRAQREAFGEQVKARFQQYQAGKITPDLLLEAQRFWAQALSAEYQAIRDYNNSLAVFELVKGTIPQHDNVVISEGALPGGVAQRAVEHQKQRSEALELRERAVPVPLVETHVDHALADVPVGADSHAAPLPQLWQAMPPLKDAPALPAPGAQTKGTAQPPVQILPPPAMPSPLGLLPPAAQPRKDSGFGEAHPAEPILAAPQALPVPQALPPVPPLQEPNQAPPDQSSTPLPPLVLPGQ